MSRTLAIAAFVTALAGGCLRANSAFHCSTDSDCARGGMPGTCEAVGYCSFVDPACASGSRFGTLSGPFANQCVGGSDDGGLDAALPSDTAVDTAQVGPPDAAALPAFAAVASAVGGADPILMYQLDVPAGDDRYLVVAVGLPSNCATTVPDIVAITFDGVALAPINAILGTPCGMATTRSVQWGVIAPDVGLHDVTVVLGGSAPQSIHSGAVSFTGIDQAAPVRASATNRGFGTTSTVDVASQPGDIVFDSVGQGDRVRFPGAPATARYRNNVDASATLNNSAGSTTQATDPTTTMGWTFGADDEWQTIATSLAGH